MIKRAASTTLWFFTVAWGWNYVALVTGAPAVVGVLLGAAAAAFVWTDPFHRIWPVTTTAATGPAPSTMSAAVSNHI
jgi:hypothetical protein